MFNQFLNSLKRPGNVNLIEAIQQGYNNIFEDVTTTFGKEPHGQVFDQVTAYVDNNYAGRLVYELDFPVQGQVNIELIETEPQYRETGVASALIQKLKEKYPDYKVSGRSTNKPAENLLNKYKIIDRTVLERK